MDNLKDKVPGYNALVVPYHLAQAAIMGMKYKFPARKLKVIGVTGTNGKTSTCFMIWKMLNAAGHKTGLMTTVAWGVDKLENQIEHMTTVDSKTLNERIAKIAEAGAEYLVLEVTSHAMAQHRIFGVPIEVAVMTNVTHDHLDYHRTFERYRDAKRKLFKKAKFGVVNADDKSGIWFMQDVKDYITYGIKHGKVQARKIKLAVSGVKYTCSDIDVKMAKLKGEKRAHHNKIEDLEIETQIPGEFNVYNSLAAVLTGARLGLTKEEIAGGIAELESVEGRMNRVDLGQDFGVIVDYAHTPDAFLKVYASVNRGVKGRVISLFGGAGRRDETTRAERGEIGAKYSDIVIITEDDSRDEDPELIAKQFAEGAENAGKKMGEDLFIELSRAKAIAMAIKMAEPGDLVLVLGKGHEKTILRADGPHDFEDLKVTRRALMKRLEKAQAAPAQQDSQTDPAQK
ncbi:UDP-N-acetylmuramoyl-L-alanyl-D-glutamate--2,6-diaminopimelate ligase [Candidatus Saccharibacteria bacterium]|nr:UDP-N-acetylmuramoyl-L-alanyl-D-glutamate--2,6-diaminopimelate ligase [Candidatus Saccharibacteria bacterium]